MANYFTAADINNLNEFATFAQATPATLAHFRKTLNIGFLANWHQSQIFQTGALSSQLSTLADTWLNNPALLTRLHRDMELYAEEVLRSSERFLRLPRTPLIGLADYASSGVRGFSKRINDEQEAMIRLATGIYTLVPRLVDYMYNNVYRFAGRQNTLADVNAGKYDIYANSLLTIFIAADPTGSRRAEAFRIIDQYQQRYALSYAAASNMIGHCTRLKEIAVECAGHAEALKGMTKRSRINNRVHVLLVSVKEMQRMCLEANGLLQR